MHRRSTRGDKGIHKQRSVDYSRSTCGLSWRNTIQLFRTLLRTAPAENLSRPLHILDRGTALTPSRDAIRLRGFRLHSPREPRAQPVRSPTLLEQKTSCNPVLSASAKAPLLQSVRSEKTQCKLVYPCNTTRTQLMHRKTKPFLRLFFLKGGGDIFQSFSNKTFSLCYFPVLGSVSFCSAGESAVLLIFKTSRPDL